MEISAQAPELDKEEAREKRIILSLSSSLLQISSVQFVQLLAVVGVHSLLWKDIRSPPFSVKLVTLLITVLGVLSFWSELSIWWKRLTYPLSPSCQVQACSALLQSFK